MEITIFHDFESDYKKTKQATQKVIHAISPDKMNWSYCADKFSIGNLIRHIAGIERFVFAEVAIGNKPTYVGCSKKVVDGYG